MGHRSQGPLRGLGTLRGPVSSGGDPGGRALCTGWSISGHGRLGRPDSGGLPLRPCSGGWKGQGSDDWRTGLAWSDLLGSCGPDFPGQGTSSGGRGAQGGWLLSCFGESLAQDSHCPPPQASVSGLRGTQGRQVATDRQPKSMRTDGDSGTDAQARDGDGALWLCPLELLAPPPVAGRRAVRSSCHGRVPFPLASGTPPILRVHGFRGTGSSYTTSEQARTLRRGGHYQGHGPSEPRLPLRDPRSPSL